MGLAKSVKQYLGVIATNPPDFIVVSRAPTASDTKYRQGQLWMNSAADSFYAYAGSGTWVLLGGAASDVNTLTADTGGALSPTAGNINILGGAGIVTSGSGSTITISTPGGFETTVVTADTPMAVNSGYITNKAGTAATMTLPAVAAVGDSVRISGLGATSYAIAQNAGQTIRLNATSSTTGVGGSATPTSRYQTIELMCIVANTDWTILSTSDAVTIV